MKRNAKPDDLAETTSADVSGRYTSLLGKPNWWDYEIVAVASGLYWDGITERPERPLGCFQHEDTVSIGARKIEGRMLDAIERNTLPTIKEENGHYLLDRKKALRFVHENIGIINAEVRAESDVVRQCRIDRESEGNAPEGTVSIPGVFRHLLEDVEVEDNDISIWFDQQGQRWQFSFWAERGSVSNLKGMKYLAELLRNPNRGMSADILHRMAHDDETETFDGSLQLFDGQAQREYLKRARDLREDIETARANGREAEALESEQELETLQKSISAGQSLSGKLRSTNPDLERKRFSVGKAIKRAISEIETVCPEFSKHLRLSISYGAFLTYSPKKVS